MSSCSGAASGGGRSISPDRTSTSSTFSKLNEKIQILVPSLILPHNSELEKSLLEYLIEIRQNDLFSEDAVGMVKIFKEALYPLVDERIKRFKAINHFLDSLKRSVGIEKSLFNDIKRNAEWIIEYGATSTKNNEIINLSLRKLRQEKHKVTDFLINFIKTLQIEPDFLGTIFTIAKTIEAFSECKDHSIKFPGERTLPKFLIDYFQPSFPKKTIGSGSYGILCALDSDWASKEMIDEGSVYDLSNKMNELLIKISFNYPTKQIVFPKLIIHHLFKQKTYYLNPLINGKNLGELLFLNKEPFKAIDVLNFAYQTANLIGILHRLNIVHGDIKPENILKSEDKIFIVDCDNLVGLGDILITDQDGYNPYSEGLPASFSHDYFALGATLFKLYCMTTWHEAIGIKFTPGIKVDIDRLGEFLENGDFHKDRLIHEDLKLISIILELLSNDRKIQEKSFRTLIAE